MKRFLCSLLGLLLLLVWGCQSSPTAQSAAAGDIASPTQARQVVAQRLIRLGHRPDEAHASAASLTDAEALALARQPKRIQRTGEVVTATLVIGLGVSTSAGMAEQEAKRSRRSSSSSSSSSTGSSSSSRRTTVSPPPTPPKPTSKQCTRCKGVGEIAAPGGAEDDYGNPLMIKCPDCGGDGKIE